MADSNSTLTRSQIIERAFRRFGVDSPSTNESALAAELLNDIVAELDPKGRWFWAISNTESTLTLTSGTGSYSVGTGADEIQNYISSLETVVLERSANQRIPLRIIPKTESLSSYEHERTSGEPYMVHLEVAADPANQKIRFLPIPDSDYTIKYTYKRMLYDFTAASDNPDLMRSMRLGLIKILSAELAPEYGVPMAERQMLLAESEQAKHLFVAHNSEDGVTATPVCADYF